MIKNLLKLIIVWGLIIGGFFVTSSPAYAVNCARPIGGNFTVTTDCTFAGLADGIDTGTGTSNTAVLTIQSGILTVNSNQIIAVGSISMTGGSIAANGQIKTKMPLWLVDADADGYPVNTTQYVQTSTPSNGRRRNVMTSITVVDCSDSNYSSTNCCPIPGNYFGDGSDGNVTISSNTSLANTADGDYVVREYNTLTINSGVTLTTQNRAKGMLIYVKGNAIINGTLSMTARGASANPTTAGVSAAGLRLPMLRSGSTETLSAANFAGAGAAVISAVANQQGISSNGIIFEIVRTGGAGGNGRCPKGDGYVGGTKTNGAGGGGGGGKRYTEFSCSGSGGDATCFSGGSGGGGSTDSGWGGSANDYGGAGGNGVTGGGGAGNPPGTGGSPAAEAGTGGVIWLIVGGNLTIGASGIISANGKIGGHSAAGGAGSGGGVVKIIYAGSLSNSGSITVAGGVGGFFRTYPKGGIGGSGSYEIVQVGTGGLTCP